MRKLLLIVVVLFTNNCIAQVQIGDLYYYLTGTSATVAFKGYGFYKNDTYIIPSKVSYNGLDYTVTEIGELAFNACILSRVVLPNTLTTLGRGAFASCSNLTSIIIPSSVKSFDSENPFNWCTLLREMIYLPATPPDRWTAAPKTYVPDKQAYVSPQQYILLGNSFLDNVQIIEMITFNQKEFEYSGQAPSTTWTNNVEGYDASLSLSALSGDVGDHVEWIPVSFTKGSESFTANVAYRYTVKPAKLTVKVTNAIREYGEDNPQFDISYSGFVNGENENVITSTPTINTTATKSSNVGEYPITISGGSAKNYKFVYEPGVLTVTKAPLSAKVNDATKVYGSQNPSFTIDYYGLKNNESVPAWTTTPTFQTDASQSSSVGKYTVKAVNGVTTNYDLREITPGTLSVSPAQLTIKANDAVRQYYEDDPTLSYICNGFVNNENEGVLTKTPSLSTSATRTSNVGTYEIKIGETSSPNYSISYINGTLTITPRTLTASAGNCERLYNEENPAFVVSYDGFVGNDNERSLSEKPTASTSATKTSDVGTYPITLSGGSADNYKFSYVSGILTINKAEQIISWDQDLNGLNIGDQVELKAEATSGLPISYSIDNSSIAEIYSAGNKCYLDCKAAGEFQIIATQDGNKNYYSSMRIRKNGVIGNGTAIELTKDYEVEIHKTSLGVRIINPNVEELIRVYSADGILQSVIIADKPVVDIPLVKNSLYVIKVGSKTVKIGN